MKKQKNRDTPRFKLNQTRVLSEMKLTLQKRKKLPKLTSRDNKICIGVQPQITKQARNRDRPRFLLPRLTSIFAVFIVK